MMNDEPVSLKPGLYVTATPIGNLGDITYRAVETLKAADRILCEDTRRTQRLCEAYDIKTPRAAYHEHNAARVRPGLLDALKDGAAFCLVSDAGTPLISDPGFKLVQESRAAEIDVFAVPGPCAAVAALSAAGAPSDRFVFAGFPPSKDAQRRRFFQELSAVDGTLVFYETARRLSESLEALADVAGDRDAIVARELTKLHEEYVRGSARELARRLADAPVKGEIVVLVPPEASQTVTEEYLDAFLMSALQEGSVKEAAGAAASALGVARKTAYERALALQNKK